MAKTEIILGESGGKRIVTGTFTLPDSSSNHYFESGDLGFTPSFVYVGLYGISGTSLTGNQFIAVYNKNIASDKTIRINKASSSANYSGSACDMPDTVNGNRLQYVANNKFKFDGTSFDGTYYYVAVE